MGVEIERKFLVLNEDWKVLASPVHLRQGYLNSSPDRVVRVRIEGETANLTIKGRSQGIFRHEWEYPIPISDANDLLDTLCERPLIEKYRYRITINDLVWEVDEFLGENAGLVVAEVELENVDQAFVKPSWLGAEVSHEHRYANASLLKHPFSMW
ncbi:CYTH domain-containing protein [Undibacterium fentianense]|uniref:CYTH domain-containing protein n=1 Tax=Undibacterium fentianense TaxID=2828728 RepID=A0A941E2U4_9BURK|nr:CYTH domain-containing protein [Undibacterium fentianense]MBR7798673.1 CYTH domain-containing protein [Undibacterium fentianense]